MTAEIAILNRSAVALAADSAVTVGSERGQKIFNTVNKLFTLSKYQPVGVMIYGSAQVMGVPWETIIKAYRRSLGKSCFPHLEKYAEKFLSFLDGNRQLFPAVDQQQYFKALISAFYHRVNEDIRSQAKKQIEKSGGITLAQTRHIVRTEIVKHFEELQALPNLPRFTERFAARLARKFSRTLKNLRGQFFQKLPLSASDLTKLRTMSGWVFIKNNPRVQGSGLVVAGFGDKDSILPKDELAAMAESLVSLTSFKRKFSFDAETVGGPVDVAVLSKGDGFIWIKHKHYFKSELNPQFLTNYFNKE